MDDQEKALNESGEETAPTTPVEEETSEDQEQPQAPVEEESSQKKGFTKRVQELANKAKTAEQRAASLEAQLAELTSQVGQGENNFSPYMPPAKPIAQPGEELTAEELDKRLTEREQRLLQVQELRLQQERALNRINREAGEVVRAFKQLDPDSDDFDEELSTFVTEATGEYIKGNPNGSVKSFVSKLMKPYQRQVTREVAATTEQVAKQVSEAAIRPSSAKPEDKKFGELSIEEMEAKLGFAHD
jgi:hypothetical protein